MPEYKKDGYTFIAPSKTQGKKYDVYKGDKKLASFGALGYQQYHDKIGHYSNLDHLNEDRRYLYNQRHEKDKDIHEHAGWFASKYLW
jgi:hypothetical protein